MTKTISLLYILSLSLRELIIFHVTEIVKLIGIIHKWSFCLPTTSLCALYYSLVHLCLIYCVSVSGSTSHSKFNCIVTSHEKMKRLLESYPGFHTIPNLKISSMNSPFLNFKSYILIKLGNLVFLFTKGILPNWFM